MYWKELKKNLGNNSSNSTYENCMLEWNYMSYSVNIQYIWVDIKMNCDTADCGIS